MNDSVSAAVPTRVTCVDYCPERCQVEEISDIPAFIESHRPAWSQVRWICVVGLSEIDVLMEFAEKYQLHPLALEDTLHTSERPKVEDYPASEGQPGRLFIVARAVNMKDGELVGTPINMFLGRTTLLIFQESSNEAFDRIMRRLQVSGSELREKDVSYLLHSLLDAIVDSYFPALEKCAARMEELEDELLDDPDQGTLAGIHKIRRQLLLARRTAWPMRDIISQIQRERHECLSEEMRPYFRDIHDHCIQIIELLESYRDIAAALTETYMSIVSGRLNEVMKVLTVIGTVFLPMTFLAGVYGMNMPIPENHWWYSYPLFWLLCIGMSVGMIFWFRKRGWI